MDPAILPMRKSLRAWPMPILNLSAETDIYYELIEGDPARPAWSSCTRDWAAARDVEGFSRAALPRLPAAVAWCMTALAMASRRRWRRGAGSITCTTMRWASCRRCWPR